MKSQQTRSLLIIGTVVLVLSGIVVFALFQQQVTGNPTSPSINQTLANQAPANQTASSTGELDIAICDPARGPFSLTIDNPFFPLPVGKVHILESPSLKVQISVLDQTEAVAGVTTRVVEEREWENGNLIEVSRNFFVQAPDGTVCYFGEDVDIYQNGQIVDHEGAWKAGTGENKPGIFMPANPTVGQSYQQEIAPGIANDHARHTSLSQTYTTPAGTFNDILVVDEDPPSTKRYARGIGLIFDDGLLLTQYS